MLVTMTDRTGIVHAIVHPYRGTEPLNESSAWHDLPIVVRSTCKHYYRVECHRVATPENHNPITCTPCRLLLDRAPTWLEILTWNMRIVVRLAGR